jgi:phage FluMu protein Com
MKHFSTEEWIDFANEAIAKGRRQEMQSHLDEGCPRCKKVASLWQKVRQTAKSVAECQPPESAVRIAKAGFSAGQLQGKPARVPGLVEVLFDSFLQPAVEGARSEAVSGMRQMLYRADPYQVDVQIEAKPGANKLVVTGQLLDLRNPDAPGRDVPVIISNLRGHVVRTVTNEFGEFREEVQSSSDLELKLLGDDDQAVIISLRDALGRLPDTVN